MTLEVAVTDDLDACLAIREVVFIQEQAVPVEVERDGVGTVLEAIRRERDEVDVRDGGAADDEEAVLVGGEAIEVDGVVVREVVAAVEQHDGETVE